MDKTALSINPIWVRYETFWIYSYSKTLGLDLDRDHCAAIKNTASIYVILE